VRVPGVANGDGAGRAVVWGTGHFDAVSEKPRFEAVSREGGSPYALISSDAREIWRELRGD
jgi:hypothetical protein